MQPGLQVLAFLFALLLLSPSAFAQTESRSPEEQDQVFEAFVANYKSACVAKCTEQTEGKTELCQALCSCTQNKLAAEKEQVLELIDATQGGDLAAMQQRMAFLERISTECAEAVKQRTD